jgi:hypothetical protein
LLVGEKARRRSACNGLPFFRHPGSGAVRPLLINAPATPERRPPSG